MGSEMCIRDSHRTGEDLGAMSLDAFTALLKEEVDTMAIK